MNDDILKEYFSRVERPLTKDDFERRLIASLHKRIIRIEHRQYIVSTILKVFAVVATLALFIYITPEGTFQGVFQPIELSPTGSILVVQVAILLTIGLIWQYCHDECQLRKLKERIKKSNQSENIQ